MLLAKIKFFPLPHTHNTRLKNWKEILTSSTHQSIHPYMFITYCYRTELGSRRCYPRGHLRRKNTPWTAQQSLTEIKTLNHVSNQSKLHLNCTIGGERQARGEHAKTALKKLGIAPQTILVLRLLCWQTLHWATQMKASWRFCQWKIRLEMIT